MEDPEAVAKGICLRALTGAAKTRKQLAELLAKKEVPEEAANAVLDRFTDVGLIDDAAFAAAWVTSRQSGRGLARRALAAELRAKGVDGEVAAAAVAEVDPQSEWDSARRLVERKVPSMRRLDRVTAERRLMGMLARKGYGGGLAGYVVREALDADGAAEDAAAEDAAAEAEPFEAEPSRTTPTQPAQSRTPSEPTPSRTTPSRSTSFGRRSARAGSAAAAEPDDEPTWSGAEPPVWTAARSAARKARAAAAELPDDAVASPEVGEGWARPISRGRQLPEHLLRGEELP
ncbi:Regulatory protein recX (modular protein) [Modestobacter italicus]|uniref:Regulatory protein RecX n=2 Tax=Modestobacter italicus (strain DSM 44449 / CECT 9708 / BC 501) TaxID=2732864 RepID=I4F236_MODI5|nr:Regulatory protein recX (modular protein) [Modestobacter marinus]